MRHQRGVLGAFLLKNKDGAERRPHQTSILAENSLLKSFVFAAGCRKTAKPDFLISAHSSETEANLNVFEYFANLLAIIG